MLGFVINMFFSASLYATAIELGLNMGGWIVHDEKVKETFGRDFSLNGDLGLYDDISGWEIRANLGNYHNVSHHPLDIGADFQISVTQLTGSIIYNAAKRNVFLQPYIGAGAGAYFYNLKNALFGNLESGTKYGFHLLSGIRFRVNRDMHFSLEYNYHVIPKIFFNNAETFNSSEITFGFGWLIDMPGYTKELRENNYDPITYQIEQLTQEIQVMKTKRAEMEDAIDKFYTEPYLISTDLISCLDNDKLLKNGILLIIDPTENKMLLKGEIISVHKNRSEIKLVLKKDKWTTNIMIKRNPLKIFAGNELIEEINEENAKKTLLVSNISDSQAFSFELRKVRYYERKLPRLDQQIAKAQTELQVLNKQWQDRQQKIKKNNNYAAKKSNTTIIKNTYIERHRTRRPLRKYMFYNPSHYRPPVNISKPKSPSIEEKEEYIERKKEYIEKKKQNILDLKNR
jgi:opacity protein-like surface antigen